MAGKAVKRDTDDAIGGWTACMRPDRCSCAFREAKEARQKQRDKEIALLLAG